MICGKFPIMAELTPGTLLKMKESCSSMTVWSNDASIMDAVYIAQHGDVLIFLRLDVYGGYGAYVVITSDGIEGHLTSTGLGAFDVIVE